MNSWTGAKRSQAGMTDTADKGQDSATAGRSRATKQERDRQNRNVREVAERRSADGAVRESNHRMLRKIAVGAMRRVGKGGLESEGRKCRVVRSDWAWRWSNEAPLCTAQSIWTRWVGRCRIRTTPWPTASATRPSADRTQRACLINSTEGAQSGSGEGQIEGPASATAVQQQRSARYRPRS